MDFLKRFFEWFHQSDKPQSSAEETLQNIAQSYGIKIEWDEERTKGSVTHLSAGADQLPQACRLLESEMLMYSASIIKESRLEKVVLCTSLRHNNSGAGGAMVADQGLLYLDVGRLDAWNPTKRAFHHELFHCIDYRDDTWKYSDPDWEKFNDAGFNYSRAKFHNRQNKFVHRLGFLSTYSMTAVFEDKAELYAHLIVNYRSVLARADNDPILKKKVARMQELLKHFCKEFNYVFWDFRRRSSVDLPNDHAAVLPMKIWKERVSGKRVWFLRRLDMPEARTLTFYNWEELMECFEKLGLNDFDEVNLLYTEKEELELVMRIPQQKLLEVWS